MESGAIITAALFAIMTPCLIGLIAWVGKRTHERIDRIEARTNQHDIDLARSDEKFDFIRRQLDEIRVSVKKIEQSQK